MLVHKPYPFLRRHWNTIYYFFYNPIVALYRKIYKPHNQGVKVLLFNKERLLLVRIGYAHKMWGLPGGAIERNETAKAAALRELQEETGANISEARHIGELTWQKDGLVTIQYFVGRTDQEKIYIDGQEIVDAGWFSLDNLPKDNLNPTVHKIIALYEESKN